jgi:HK97 gp10 family phage protein
MAGVSFKIEGLDKLQRIYKKLPQTLKKEIKGAIDINAGLIRDAAKRDAPKDENRLSQSISKKSGSGINAEIIAQTSYAGYMEFGTKSRARIPAGLESVAAQFRGKSEKGDPIKALTGWVKRKGISGRGRGRNADARARSVAFMIFKSIMHYGVRPHPFFFDKLEKFKPSIKSDVADAIDRALNAK